MTTEIIKEIKETERMTEERLRAVNQEAKELLLRAEDEAVSIVKSAENQELLKSKEQLEEAEKEAKQEADIKRRQNNERCLELKAKAAQKMEDAVNLVMERIVSMNGNS